MASDYEDAMWALNEAIEVLERNPAEMEKFAHENSSIKLANRQECYAWTLGYAHGMLRIAKNLLEK